MPLLVEVRKNDDLLQFVKSQLVKLRLDKLKKAESKLDKLRLDKL